MMDKFGREPLHYPDEVQPDKHKHDPDPEDEKPKDRHHPSSDDEQHSHPS
jgi:hypothetical protein